MSEAELQYRVAVAALKESNFPLALSSLEKAAALAPGNGLIFYNLAIVLEKLNQPERGLDNLRKAMSVGLPAATQSAANELLVRLTYLREKVGGDLQGFEGTWVSIQEFPRTDESCSTNTKITRSLTTTSIGTSQMKALIERRSTRTWRHGTRYRCSSNGDVDNSTIVREVTIDTSSGRDEEFLFGSTYVRGRWYRGEQRVVSCAGVDCDSSVKQIENLWFAVIGRDLALAYDVGTPEASQIIYRRP